ncbi:MAG: HAMP domain-containing histidine kinase [Verrucomicrobia bacterium]|nr:HAMP domain-containing histidine kinase [Verrucomicrobiota bacterium]MBI3868452.1 HAMP domain-containing histidine kinase [Verrucomicrobiota bacterium]
MKRELSPTPHRPSLENAEDIERISIGIPAIAVGIALAVLATTLWFARAELRSRVREQIVARDGVVLHSVMQMSPEAPHLSDPPTQLTLMLETSRLRGVLGARLFDRRGGFVQGFPPNVMEGSILPDDLPILSQLRAVSRFHPSLAMTDFILPGGSNDPARSAYVPVLEVNIPLHPPGTNELSGIAQFIIAGEDVAAEFEQLDSHLDRQAAVAFLMSGSLIAIGIALGFRRLRHSYSLLQQRTLALLGANRELVQSAKTSAVGAVTSHLIHELRNPLSGVHNLMAQQAAAAKSGPDAELWQEALSATSRMHATVQEITGLLREDQSSARYQVPVSELSERVARRLASSSARHGVPVQVTHEGGGELGNRTANLVALILVNLAENGIHATPAGGQVRIHLRCAGKENIFTVRDEGFGFPEFDPARLFHPKPSTREGGSGLGLAICKQLANALGASLSLSENTAEGCLFELRLSD